MEETTRSTQTYYCHQLAGQHLWLLPQKAIYWQEHNMLLLADLHLGKAGHFRKAGIPISGAVHRHDLQELDHLLQEWQPAEVIFLGDLFHSTYNSEWQQLENWMDLHPAVNFTLIKGNHDILPKGIYSSSRLQIEEENMLISPFLLTHHPPAASSQPGEHYLLCGHVHPAIQLQGSGRQQLSLPCFYFGLHYAILPAFGKFTGFYKIKPKTGDRVFGILPHRVMALDF